MRIHQKKALQQHTTLDDHYRLSSTRCMSCRHAYARPGWRLKTLSFLAGLQLILGPSNVVAAPRSPEIQAIIKKRVDLGYNVSLVVAVVDEDGTQYYSYGKPAKNSTANVNENTLYEIGSITKTFTAILFADQLERGQMQLDDTIDKYLPDGLKTPTYFGQKIRLVDLATHTSGLPTVPTNMTITDTAHPYANYTVEKLYDFLSSFNLTRKIGSKFEYSNLGMGLLAHIITLKTGQDYERLVVTKICDPLGMKSTRITLSPELQQRLATGYGVGDESVMDWDMSVLAGAGDLRSSAKDLATYVAANLGLRDHSMTAAMNRSHQVIRQGGFLGAATALAWQVIRKNDRKIIMHTGGTIGYRSFIGFDKKRKLGVVVLSNSTYHSYDIGLHILKPSKPLEPLSREVELNAALLQDYEGTFRIEGGITFEFKSHGDSLTVLQAGAPTIKIYPESTNTFFYKSLDAKFTFVRDDKGLVNQIILHQFGKEIPGKRIAEDDLRKEIKIDPSILDAYVGVFRIGPNLSFEFQKEGDKLMVIQTGAPKMQIYPESPTKFFYKIVDAQFSFVADKNGHVNKIILHQFGREMNGWRAK